MLIPELSQNHALTKFVPHGEVHRITFFLLCASIATLHRLLALFLLCSEPPDML